MKRPLPAITPQTPGPAVPRRGHWLLAGLGRLILKLMGWRIVGSLPNVERAVLAVAPHTSNMDGVIGLSAIQALRIYVRFMGKHTLFEGRFGRLMYWLGGIPVNRENAHDLVEQTAQAMQQEPCWLGIAPEGTRKGAARWKTGFYRIAEAQGIPIVVLGFCYRRKQVRVVGSILPSGDMDADLESMVQMLGEIVPRHPALLSEPFRKLTGR